MNCGVGRHETDNGGPSHRQRFGFDRGRVVDIAVVDCCGPRLPSGKRCVRGFGPMRGTLARHGMRGMASAVSRMQKAFAGQL